MKIIFLNDKKLAQNLREGEVSESEKLFYFLFFLIILPAFSILEDLFFSELAISNNKAGGNQIFYTVFLEMIPYIIALYSFVFCYKLYIKKKGVLFVDKAICLLFPIYIKVFALKLLLIILAGFVLGILDGAKITQNASDSPLTTHIINVIGTIYLFFRLKLNVLIMSKS